MSFIDILRHAGTMPDARVLLPETPRILHVAALLFAAGAASKLVRFFRRREQSLWPAVGYLSYGFAALILHWLLNRHSTTAVILTIFCLGHSLSTIVVSSTALDNRTKLRHLLIALPSTTASLAVLSFVAVGYLPSSDRLNWFIINQFAWSMSCYLTIITVGMLPFIKPEPRPSISSSLETPTDLHPAA